MRGLKVHAVLLAAVMGVAVAPSLAPLVARADGHCDVPIYIFSETYQQTPVPDPTRPGRTIDAVPNLNSEAIGCTVVRDTVLGGSSDPTTDPLTETDYIYPGSNLLSVRFLNNGSDPSVVASAKLTWAGQTFTLDMQAGVDVTGAAAPWLDSAPVIIDPGTTVTGNTAVATICLVDNGGCQTRTYSTLA